jgi:hypothetical protein
MARDRISYSFAVCALVLISAALNARADEPSTANPGLKYYYPLPRDLKPETLKVDVCVYGGTPGGFAAALQARRMGKSVVLAVFRRHVGGVTSAGLTAVDLGAASSIGGIAAEFLDRIGKWTDFRPSDAEKTFRKMLAEAKTPVLYEQRLKSVQKAGNRITSITFEGGLCVEARMFIDATYEGDLFAAAGVPFHVGREDNSEFDETINGFQIARLHQFRFPVDPYRVKGDPKSARGTSESRLITSACGR